MKYTNISANIQPSAMMLCFVTIVTMVCLIPYNCYAKTEAVLIELKCNNDWNFNEVSQRYYPGDKKIKYSLNTIGMKTAWTGEELITNWYEKRHEYAQVVAVCGPDITVQTDMLPIGEEHLPSLTCQRGQSLTVSLCYPMNQDPNAYRYYGKLTINIEEDEKIQEELTNVIMGKSGSHVTKLSESKIYFDNFNDEYTPLIEKQKREPSSDYKNGVANFICSITREFRMKLVSTS